jgi:hypothetical protein
MWSCDRKFRRKVTTPKKFGWLTQGGGANFFGAIFFDRVIRKRKGKRMQLV